MRGPSTQTVILGQTRDDDQKLWLDCGEYRCVLANGSVKVETSYRRLLFMVDETSSPSDQATAKAQPNIRVMGQYIKDLSFESPNVGKVNDGPVENPQLQVEVNVNARQVGPSVFESVIAFEANATSKTGALYKLAIDYGGMFKLENMPQQAVEPFLLVNAPSLLFPFVRRLIADLTREGGFPPLMLDPIDFASLYVRRKQDGGAGSNGSQPVN